MDYKKTIIEQRKVLAELMRENVIIDTKTLIKDIHHQAKMFNLNFKLRLKEPDHYKSDRALFMVRFEIIKLKTERYKSLLNLAK